MLPPPSHSRWSLPWPLGLLAGLFVFLDFMMPGMFAHFARESDGRFLFGITMGFIVGQMGLAVLWGVFGSPPLAARWLILLAVIELGPLATLLGAAMAEARGPDLSHFLRVAGVFLLRIPLVFLVLQLPLGILRALTGWQLAPCGGERLPGAARQFRLLDLFTVTTIAALSLGLAQAGMSIAAGLPAEPPPGILLRTLMGGFGMLAALNAALGLPCLWAVFGVRSGAGAIAILFTTCCFLLMIVVFMIGPTPGTTGVQIPGFPVIVEFTIGSIPGGNPELELAGLLVAFELAYAAVVWGGLRLLREAQYELVRPRAKRAGAAEIGPTATGGDSPLAPPSPGP